LKANHNGLTVGQCRWRSVRGMSKINDWKQITTLQLITAHLMEV